MQPERWKQIKDLLARALERAPAERDPWLCEQCNGDEQLRADAQSLLREMENDVLLEIPDPEKVGHFLREHRAAAGVGRRIGKFTVSDVLGYGGMGVVYRAEQEDPRREVALKIIPAGMHASPYQLKLFRREVQSLARMQHAGIAALYESGRAEDGNHFFAMELVEGAPLLEFAAKHGLDAPAKLTLFAKICDAVHYAHQRGVIHRDIKPTNVLVTDSGQPKLLDFGLAKLTEPDSGTVSTLLGKVHGTLAYMSPEQAQGRGDEIDIRSDVYSLGVLLYELLTGRRPYDLSPHVPETIRQICEDPPIRPSTITRMLRGDLETIVLKALEKDPSRRYDSAAALAEDVRRFLDKQPIAARPASTSYQLRRLAARHRGLLASVACIALLLVGSVVALSVLYARARGAEAQARSEAERADQRAKTAERLAGFLAEVFGENYPQTKSLRTLTAEDLLNIGVEKIHAELQDEPESQGYLLEVMSLVFKFHGDFDRAAELDRAAMTYRAKVFAPDAPHMAASMANLAHDLLEMDQFAEAENYARPALDIFLANYGPDNYFSATVLSTLGRSITEHHPDAAETKIREALRALRTLRGETAYSVGRTKLYLAEALIHLGQFTTSESFSREVVEAPSPDADFQMIRPQAHLLLAKSLLHQHRLAEARATSAKAMEMAIELFGAEPRSKVVEIVCTQAAIEQAAGNLGGARELYEKAVSMARTARWVAPLDLANALAGLAGIQVTNVRQPSAILASEPSTDQGSRSKVAEIESLYTEALDIRLTCLGSHHPLVAGAARGLGLALQAQGRFEEAEDLLLESFLIYSARAAEGGGHAVQVADEIAKLYEVWGRPDKAAAWQEKLRCGSASAKNGST